MSFNASIVSNGLQLENLALARPTMERPWERLLQVRTSHKYHMRFSDACGSSHCPPVAATGFVAPGSAPPPCRLPHRPHTSTGAFPRPLAYPEVSSISSFSVQRLTTRRSSQARPDHVTTPGASSISLMYVRYTDIEYTQPSHHTPFFYVIILFIIMIIMHYYKFYFSYINNVRRHSTSNVWPQPQT